MATDVLPSNVANVVYKLSSPGQPSLSNLFTHHKHQAQLLCQIFAQIKDRPAEYLRDGSLVDNVLGANRCINRLQRELQGGPLAAWFQAHESQEELTRIQHMLAPHYKTVLDREKFQTRIQDAITKDDARRRATIEDLCKKMQFKMRRRLWQRPSESYLQALLPQIKVDDPSYWSTFKSILEKFPPASDPSLALLMTELHRYADEKLDGIFQSSSAPLQLQVLRKPSGSIVTIILGCPKHTDIQLTYYPDAKQEKQLPFLYTLSSHSESQDMFVVAANAIQQRPDSKKYARWVGPHSPPSTDIYVFDRVEAEPFIIATLLGKDVSSDVVVSLPRTSAAVKDAIQQIYGQPWISDRGWESYEMADLKCNDARLIDYDHQIFVPGPRFFD